MPLGIYAWVGIPVPFTDRIAMIRDAGFETTSLWWEQDDPVRRRIRELAPEIVRNAGLTLDHIHVPYKHCAFLWRTNEEERLRVVDQHMAWIEDCRRQEIPVMVMHVTASQPMSPASRAAGLDSFRRIIHLAEDAGVTVALENTRHPSALYLVLDELPSLRLGLCFDSGHAIIHGKEPFELLHKWGHRLITTHLSDNDGILDRHWLPGDGVIDFQAMARAVDWPAYQGPLMLEVSAQDKEADLPQFLAAAHSRLSALADNLYS